MKIGSKTLSLFLAVSIISTATFAASLEGAFKGENLRTEKSDDVMALILQKDQQNADNYYALLAEYTRDPVLAKSALELKKAGKFVASKFLSNWEKTTLTRWIPRMYAYYMKKVSDTEYSLHTIRVSQDGELSPDAGVAAILTLSNANSIIGANLKRPFKVRESVAGVEVINFKDTAVSTWEDYVDGNFFGSKDSTGGDYFDSTVNMSLSKDGVATYTADNEDDKDGIEGEFNIVEKHPKIFTLTAKGANNKGNEKVTGKIGVFVDIVNWKSFGIKKFTTEEFLLINPENPSDVGFYYERH